jgi:hypothetical protein
LGKTVKSQKKTGKSQKLNCLKTMKTLKTTNNIKRNTAAPSVKRNNEQQIIINKTGRIAQETQDKTKLTEVKREFFEILSISVRFKLINTMQ